MSTVRLVKDLPLHLICLLLKVGSQFFIWRGAMLNNIILGGADLTSSEALRVYWIQKLSNKREWRSGCPLAINVCFIRSDRFVSLEQRKKVLQNNYCAVFREAFTFITTKLIFKREQEGERCLLPSLLGISLLPDPRSHPKNSLQNTMMALKTCLFSKGYFHCMTLHLKGFLNIGLGKLGTF